MTDTYDAQKDLAESIKLGFRIIREREAAKPKELRSYEFAKREHKPQVIEDRPFGVAG